MYRTIGLSLRTWALIDEAFRHPVFLECYGRSASTSDALEWIIRSGIIRIRTDPIFNEIKELAQ
jgi:hypothetical protein